MYYVFYGHSQQDMCSNNNNNNNKTEVEELRVDGVLCVILRVLRRLAMNCGQILNKAASRLFSCLSFLSHIL